METSYIELSRAAYQNNLKFIRKQIGEKARFSSVVKGNAYGHGIENFVPLAESCGVNHFSVFNSHEALRVHRVKQPETELMIMGSIDHSEIEWAVENEIGFFVFDFPRLEAAVKVSERVKKPAKVHIELETGLNRTGFKKEDILHVIEFLKGYQSLLDFEGLCTHYAGAESVTNYLRVREQIKKFNRYTQLFGQHKLKPRYRHTACSAALLAYPATIMDMVRCGIAQYGFWPSNETHIQFLTRNEGVNNPLKRVISWKSWVMGTKDIKKGEFVGYGTSFLAPRDMRLAVVPVGYSNGYSRSLSNQGSAIIRGKRVPLVGVVNMNMIILNISAVPDVVPGDEVVLIGKQKNHSISVSSFGEMSQQLNYELLTRLPESIPRHVID